MQDREEGARCEASRTADVGYAPANFRVTRRQWRVLITLTLINTVMLGWLMAGSGTVGLVQSQWTDFRARREQRAQEQSVVDAQRECLNHVMPPGEVAYTEDPATSLRLLSAGASYRAVPVASRGTQSPPLPPWTPPARRAEAPDCWQRFAESRGMFYRTSFDPDATLLFLGRRVTPGGEEVLVVAQVESSAVRFAADASNAARVEVERKLRVTLLRVPLRRDTPAEISSQTLFVILPPTQAKPHRSGDGWDVTRPAFLTFRNGQPDPQKPAHFVLPYDVNGVRDEIGVWLTEDGVVFNPPSGELVVDQDGRLGWEVPLPPGTETTRPATRP